MGSLSEVIIRRAKRESAREFATRMFQGGETMEYVQKYVHLDVEELEAIKEECERQQRVDKKSG